MALQNSYKFRFRGRLSIFIRNFLFSRHFIVHTGHQYSSLFNITDDVPQSSYLSTVLFNLASNDITGNIHISVKCNLFANNLTTFIPCTNITLDSKSYKNQSTCSVCLDEQQRNNFFYMLKPRPRASVDYEIANMLLP